MKFGFDWSSSFREEIFEIVDRLADDDGQPEHWYITSSPQVS